ncbi:MAG TPA: FAD-dependent oxidoreductase [Gaiellaceae bacterium]|nr:FAD-dependent oxidoreductase [Gaiellaceae bacterium]
MARIVVAGSGAIGASVAYHLALFGADSVVVADRGELCGGSTSRAMGGVRQQFSTAAEVVLARESIDFLAALGPRFFRQVGYLFVATTEEGLAGLEERRALQNELGVPVERVDPAVVAGLATDDVLGATCCWSDGVADPPAVARELLRRASELGVEVREHVAAEELDRDVLVIACGPWSPELAATVGVDLPIRPLCRQLLETSALAELPDDLPMVIEVETGFHFRRRGDRLLLAMGDPEPRWTFETTVDESLVPDRLERLVHRYPRAAGATIERSWAGLYDMTPDAHPIVGRVAEGVYAACGFSGHGFMQSPAVGRALAEQIVGREPSVDLSPYALERFEHGATFPERLVL